MLSSQPRTMLEPGELIDGKYRVRRLLGKGGMGAVFEGFHTLVDRRVAIKVLHPEVAASPEGAGRFEREVRAAGRIGSEHILEIYDVGSLPDGSRYMVSEYLDGETLANRLNREGKLAPRAIAKIALELLCGLAAAHRAGVVHRDLKPDNIFLLRERAGRADFVKIIDFGISKFQVDDGAPMTMTATGAVLGTPFYLSPEQARGQRDLDGRSDVYAVGVILYQAVAGRLPIQAETFNELLFKIALESPPTLSELLPGFDSAFSSLTQKAMARDRAERFQSAAELHDALAAWLGVAERLAGATPQSGALASGRSFDSSAATQVSGVAAVTPPSDAPPTSGNFGRTAERGTAAAGAARSRALRLGAASVLVAAVAAGGVVWWRAAAPAPTTTSGPDASASAPAGALASSAVGASTSSPVAIASAGPMAATSAAANQPSPDAGRLPAAAVPAKRATGVIRASKKSGVSGGAGAKANSKQSSADPLRATAPLATAKAKATRDFGY